MSQIYEQHYRRLDASVPLRTRRYVPIAREGLKALFGFKAYLGLIALSWLPMLFRLVQVYFTTRVPDVRRIAPIDDKFFFESVMMQVPWMLIMAAYAGAGLVANDMRTGGLLLYLSRPLTLLDYIFGKVAILFVSLSMVSLLPSVVLFFGARSLAPEILGGIEHLLILPKIVAFSLVFIVPMIGLMLMMSAVAKNPRFAGLGFFFVFVGSTIAQGIAWQATRSPWAGLISLQSNMQRVGHELFGVRSTRMLAGLPAEMSVLVLTLVVAGCFMVLKSRIRAVEVVR